MPDKENFDYLSKVKMSPLVLHKHFCQIFLILQERIIFDFIYFLKINFKINNQKRSIFFAFENFIFKSA